MPREFLSFIIASMFHGGKLSVWWDGEPLCEISDGGVVHYHNADLQTPEQNEAKDRAYQITCTVFEYMRLMESAPPLKVVDLADRYRTLADFNGTVLAAAQSSHGVQFVTWDWDFDRKGVSHGHYYGGNYSGAKQDFATRSGLIPKQRIFTEEQLVPIYRACEDALEYGLDMTDHNRKIPTLKALLDYLEVTKLEDAITLAENVDSYVLTGTISSPADMAIEHIRFVAGKENADLISKHLNLYAYGQAVIQQNNAILSPYGLLHRADFQPMLNPVQESMEMHMQ